MPLTIPIREILPATPRARVVRLDLEGRAFPYAPGQAVLVATHGRLDRKPYSIAAAPEDTARDGWLELLVGVDALGEAGAHLRLERGAPIEVEGPVGTFTCPANPPADRFVFIAGGIGIAPLRAMLHHVLGSSHRSIGVFYSARTPDDFAYESELRELAREGRIELRQTVTREGAATWEGERGRLGRAILEPLVHRRATLCFICGPPTLVHDMPRLLEEIGVAPQLIRIEEWG